MSGGVDSTVAAVLLAEKGYETVGITGIMHEKMREEAKNASEACKFIGIEHHTVDLRDEFSKTVVKYFESSYKQGLTPNPCAYCNRLIKWGRLAEYAFEKLEADFFATGHYARIMEKNGSYILYKGEDLKKDQSYMLFALSRQQLSKTMFPLGNYKKTEIRQVAQNYKLNAANKKESQDVCFIYPPETTQTYLIDKFGEQEGEIVDYETGKIVGSHKGSYNFTIGQRKGIGVSASAPLYVVRADTEKNLVFVGFKELLYRQKFEVENINWQQGGYAEKGEFTAMVRIRYNSAAQEAIIAVTGEDSAQITLKEPKFAITPGQAAVFYDMNNEFIIGGGWIKN